MQNTCSFMRIIINDIIPYQEQIRYGEHWQTITGARVIRDAAILIERKAQVTVKPMASNNAKMMSLDIVVMQGKEFDTFVEWLKVAIPPQSELHGELLIKAFALAGVKS